MVEIIELLKQTGILDLLIVFGAGIVVIAIWHFDLLNKVFSLVKKKGSS